MGNQEPGNTETSLFYWLVLPLTMWVKATSLMGLVAVVQ